jgi:TRAP-type C4-dicarboxylate transport system permease small subunit
LPGLALLDRLVGGAIIAAMAAMVVVVSLQVTLRYVFNTSLDWAEDVARLLFVWSIFLAIPLGVKQGSHIAIQLLTLHLAPAVRKLLFRVMALGCAALMAVVCYQSTLLTVQQWDEFMPTLNVTAALFMVPVAFGAAHSTLNFVLLAIAGTPPARKVIE